MIFINVVFLVPKIKISIFKKIRFKILTLNTEKIYKKENFK